MNTHKFMNWLDNEIKLIEERMKRARSKEEVHYLEGRLYSLLDCRREIIVSQFSPTKRN